MDAEFIRRRITELRMKKGVSEYRMSFDLGHSRGYIQNITAGRALPSMEEFLYMCEYLGITPRDFFDTDKKEPMQMRRIESALSALSADDLDFVETLVKRLRTSSS